MVGYGQTSSTPGRRGSRSLVDLSGAWCVDPVEARGQAVAPDETDEQLMRRFQRGEARAFETLMRRHRTPIHSFLCRLTGDRARAEDLTQDAFLRMVKARHEWARSLVKMPVCKP